LGEQTRQAGADALEQARGVAYEARSHMASAAGTLRDQAAATAESQKANLSGTLEDIAKAVHRSGAQLEGQQDWLAHLVERGAAELNMLADTLRKNDLQSLLNELGSFARRQPALFVGASMAAGMALARIGRVAVTNPSGSSESSTSPASTGAAPSATGSSGPAMVDPVRTPAGVSGAGMAGPTQGPAGSPGAGS
jgi:hypothetical protein